MDNGLLYGVTAFLIGQLALGVWVSRWVKTERDYLLAGRSFGPVIASFTVFATWFGAETCMGAAGLAYAQGLAGTGSEPFGYALCLALMALVFAIPLWKRGLTTLADLFRERYGISVERVAVLLMVPTSILWGAAQIRAFGLLLSLTSGVTAELAITCAMLVVLVYTSTGGLWADALTDLVQGIVLIVGLIVMAVIVLFVVEPQAIVAIPAERLSLREAATSPLAFAELLAVPILGSVMSQELVQRVSASRSPQVARNSTLIAAAAYLLVGIVPLTLGLVAADLLPGIGDPEQVLIVMSREYLPFWLQLLLICALISAMLSTMNSALLVAGSLLAHNLVFRGRRLNERQKLLGNRVAVAVSALVAYGLAMVSGSVHDLVQEASSFGSAGILVIAVFALFTKFGGPTSAVAALAVGLGSYIVGAYVIELDAPFLASLLAATLAYVGLAFAVRSERSLTLAGSEDDEPAAAISRDALR
jgi:Na+/proline symporter